MGMYFEDNPGIYRAFMMRSINRAEGVRDYFFIHAEGVLDKLSTTIKECGPTLT